MLGREIPFILNLILLVCCCFLRGYVDNSDLELVSRLFTAVDIVIAINWEKTESKAMNEWFNKIWFIAL